MILAVTAVVVLGLDDPDMMHAYRNHWKAFATDDGSVTMYIGPSLTGAPVEVGVVVDEDGQAIVHAMAARSKFLKSDRNS